MEYRNASLICEWAQIGECRFQRGLDGAGLTLDAVNICGGLRRFSFFLLAGGCGLLICAKRQHIHFETVIGIRIKDLFAGDPLRLLLVRS